MAEASQATERQTRWRSLVKGLTWRFLATGTTVLLSFLLTVSDLSLLVLPENTHVLKLVLKTRAHRLSLSLPGSPSLIYRTLTRHLHTGHAGDSVAHRAS